MMILYGKRKWDSVGKSSQICIALQWCVTHFSIVAPMNYSFLHSFSLCVWYACCHTVSRLIQEDVRNNSAWNQRWLVSHRGKRGNHPLSLDVARREADFAIEKGARLDPYNESPWRYLVGILREQHQRQQKDSIGSTDDFTRNVIAEYEAKASGLRTVLEEAQRNPDTCVNMTSARIDLLEMVGTKESLEVATQLATSLATEHDPFRKKYWWLVVKRLQNQAKSTSGS